MESLERILKNLHAEHAALLEAFRRDLASENDMIKLRAWKRLDQAEGVEKAILIVWKELGL